MNDTAALASETLLTPLLLDLPSMLSLSAAPLNRSQNHGNRSVRKIGKFRSPTGSIRSSPAAPPTVGYIRNIPFLVSPSSRPSPLSRAGGDGSISSVEGASSPVASSAAVSSAWSSHAAAAAGMSNSTSVTACLDEVRLFRCPGGKRLREMDIAATSRTPSLEECEEFHRKPIEELTRPFKRLAKTMSTVPLTAEEEAAYQECVQHMKNDVAWIAQVKSTYPYDQATRILQLRGMLVSRSCGAYRQFYQHSVPLWETFEKPLLGEATRGAAIWITVMNLTCSFPKIELKLTPLMPPNFSLTKSLHST